MDRIQRLTGHPEAVQRQVDADLAATLDGPDTIRMALIDRPAPVLTACYRALLDRAWQERADAARDAVRRAALVQARDEATQIRKGGNR